MNRLALLFCCILIPFLTLAQNILINGSVVINETSPEGARLVVLKNGIKLHEQNIGKKGRFELKLSTGADYKLSFQKPGFISKIVTINTEVPEEVLETNPNFPPVKLIINLLPKVENVDLSIFDQAVAILAYNSEVDDFIFDKEYTEKIKDRIAQAEQAIKRELASKGAAALEHERQYAEWTERGQQAFEQKAWNEAIENWNKALALKPNEEEINRKIASARNEMKLEKERQNIEQQNRRAYQLLLASADSLFLEKQYTTAKTKYQTAQNLQPDDSYPGNRIREIDRLLAQLAQQNAEQQKQIAETEAKYKKILLSADQAMTAKNYEKAIETYQQALALKTTETYPRQKITEAEQALALLRKQQAAAAEQQRAEQEKLEKLRAKYEAIIAQADKAFHQENYALARQRYMEAQQVGLQEDYPNRKLNEIYQIINSSKYKAQQAEYHKNKTFAEKNMQQKDYAAAKVYYQKALAISAVEKELIEQKITEIERLIEAAHLAELEKAYKENIGKADKAYETKSYAIAKFYYQKALEIKIGDKYARQRLDEISERMGDRQEKEAEL